MFQSPCTIFAATLAASILSSPVAAAYFTAQELSTVFPSSQDLTGNQVATDQFDVSAVCNSTHALITLNTTNVGVINVGWLGFGVGTEMKDADMHVSWPTTDGRWVVSARQAPDGHRPPQAVSNSQGVITVVPQLSSTPSQNTNFAVISFVRPLDVNYATTSTAKSFKCEAGQEIVHAASRQRPNSSAYDAALRFHDIGEGSSKADFSGTVTFQGSSVLFGSADGTNSDGADSADSNEPWSTYDKYVVAHAVFGSLAFLIFAPLGAVLGRLLRGRTSWFAVHAPIMLFVTTCVIIAFALGHEAVMKSGGESFDSTHTQLGLAVLVLVLVQAGLGIGNHVLFRQRQKKAAVPKSRPINNWVHIVLGVSLAIIGFVQVGLGIDLYEEDRHVPKAIWIIYGILVGLGSLAYLGSSALAAHSRRQRAGERGPEGNLDWKEMRTAST